jgi:hypothetical protein
MDINCRKGSIEFADAKYNCGSDEPGKDDSNRCKREPDDEDQE